jgi:hypothetical protein
MSEESNAHGDRGPIFDGVKIGRPATGALIAAGYRSLEDLPKDLDQLIDLHGVGPRAIVLLKERLSRKALDARQHDEQPD